MSPHASPPIQRLTYSFEQLYCTLAEGETASHRPVFGYASIAFDGRGKWWIAELTCHSRHYGRPDFAVPQGGELWVEVVTQLERYRGEAIADAINAALRDGGHMALFDEHLPIEQTRRGPPPHVSFGLRKAAAALNKGARHCAAMAGFMLMMATILVGGTLATMPWPGPQARKAPPIATPAGLVGTGVHRLAKLEDGGR